MLFQQYPQIKDGGPIYAETQIPENLDNFIIEPWNAFSSLAIAAPAVYFLWKIRKEPKKYGFLLWCIPLLFLNGIGSTLFHGFRASRIMLFMDFMPAILLTLSITIYFWAKVLPKWWMVFFAVGPVFAMRFAVFRLFEPPLSINLSYAIGGTAFLLPIVLILRKSEFKKAWEIILSIICFILAIYFRGADEEYTHVVAFGTHFLWHIFTGIGAFLLADYLYFLRKKELASLETSA